MTRYNEDLWNLEGGVDELIADSFRLGYRKGVDRVIEVLEEYGFPPFAQVIRGAIDEGLI